MAEADYSLRQNLRKALDALEYEHASEMQSPRYKRHILDNDEQSNAPFFRRSQLTAFMPRILSRINFISDPITILKNRVVSLFAYSNR
jgi:hypothetical protein